jgi:hypothetical protein
MTRDAIYARLRSGRWQRIHAGVYAAYSGQPTRESLMWAAVLGARQGAVLSHQSAAELHGLLNASQGRAIHVMVQRARNVAAMKGIVIHYSKRVDVARHPALEPPRTRLEETVLDLAEAEATATGAVAWMLTACASRRTRPDLLLRAIESRPRVRRRKVLLAALGDARLGVQSILERGYLYRVERAHGLPEAVRQLWTRPDRTSRYEDIRYEEYGVSIELDGEAAHPVGERWRDTRRDNVSAVSGLIVLRYTYADVMERPCEIADEITRTLMGRGYAGGAHRCGPGCAPGDPTVLADTAGASRKPARGSSRVHDERARQAAI